MRRLAAAALTALVLVLTGCTTESGSEPEGRDSSAQGSSSAAPEESAASAPGDLPEPGTAEQPAEVEPIRDLLDWRRAGDPTRTTVTAGSAYTLAVSADSARARLDGPNGRTVRAPNGFRISDALLDEQYAVIVIQDATEAEPSRATVVDLSDGSTTRLDGRSQPPTVNGGSWALADGRVFHPTIGKRGAYCLAEVNLASGEGQTTYCADANSGFNQVRATPEGLSLLSFDDGTPSCRTVLAVGEASMEPFPGVKECAGWEGLLLPDGAIWSQVENENRIELGAVRARAGDGYYDLGTSVTGGLVWCGDAAYFSRNQETDTGPARLLRWDGESLAVVFEAGKGGPSSISAPRCGGDAISVSVLAETGDRQVTAPVG